MEQRNRHRWNGPAAGREFLSDDEWAATAKEVSTRAERRPANAAADVALAYNNEWYDRGTPLKRSSLIIDPPNGKLPQLTPEGQRRVAARAAARAARGPADSWEDRGLQERCILYHGVPPSPTGYNNNYHIAQTPDSVAIRYEMLAESPTVRTNDQPPSERPPVDGKFPRHWEGNTLVVETTGYTPKATLHSPPATSCVSSNSSPEPAV
jgi:hypothetical protein